MEFCSIGSKSSRPAAGPLTTAFHLRERRERSSNTQVLAHRNTLKSKRKRLFQDYRLLQRQILRRATYQEGVLPGRLLPSMPPTVEDGKE
jgi:hypothetical protein